MPKKNVTKSTAESDNNKQNTLPQPPEAPNRDLNYDVVGGAIKRRQNYDIRQPAEIFANIATVLAGFAIVAILLVFDKGLPQDADRQILAQGATVAFMLVFLGTILTALSFGTIRGEEILSQRTYAIGITASCCFMLSGMLFFWGIALLFHAYDFIISTSNIVVGNANLIATAAIIIAPLYVILTLFDPALTFDDIPTDAKGNAPKEIAPKEIAPIDWFLPFVPPYLPLVIAGSILVFFGKAQWQLTLLSSIADKSGLVMYSALALLCVDAVLSLIFASQRQSFRLNDPWGLCLITMHTIVLAFMLLLLPW
jgi:hypothetical protein